MKTQYALVYWEVTALISLFIRYILVPGKEQHAWEVKGNALGSGFSVLELLSVYVIFS